MEDQDYTMRLVSPLLSPPSYSALLDPHLPLSASYHLPWSLEARDPGSILRLVLPRPKPWRATYARPVSFRRHPNPLPGPEAEAAGRRSMRRGAARRHRHFFPRRWRCLWITRPRGLLPSRGPRQVVAGPIQECLHQSHPHLGGPGVFRRRFPGLHLKSLPVPREVDLEQVWRECW